MFEEIDNLLYKKEFHANDTLAFLELARKGTKINISHTDGLPWIEIDFIEDFENAKSEITSTIIDIDIRSF